MDGTKGWISGWDEVFYTVDYSVNMKMELKRILQFFCRPVLFYCPANLLLAWREFDEMRNMKQFMTNTFHTKRRNTFKWKSQGPVARKPSKREEVHPSKMMTITVTRHVGPEFNVYLPDDVSDCLLFGFCLCCHELHQELLQFRTFTGSSRTLFSAVWACWRRKSTGSPASPLSSRGSSLR